MTGIFQANIFQNNIFQVDTGTVVIPDTHDGFGATPDQYKKYRDRLLALSEASEKFQQSKYIQKEEITGQLEALETLNAEVKEQVLKADTQPQALDMQRFYDGLHAKLTLEISQALALVDKIQCEQDEEDDITALLFSGGL